MNNQSTTLRPFKCPVCDGTAIVSRPPWVAGDQPEWSSSQAVYKCGSCENGVLWKSVEIVSTIKTGNVEIGPNEFDHPIDFRDEIRVTKLVQLGIWAETYMIPVVKRFPYLDVDPACESLKEALDKLPKEVLDKLQGEEEND